MTFLESFKVTRAQIKGLAELCIISFHDCILRTNCIHTAKIYTKLRVIDAIDLKNTLRDQRNEFQYIIRKNNYIDREFGTTYGSYGRSNLIKTIIGVRRSGKSTFTATLLSGENVGYVNFDEKLLNEAKELEAWTERTKIQLDFDAI